MALVSSGQIKEWARSENLYLSAYVPTVKRLCEIKESGTVNEETFDRLALHQFRKLAVKSARDLGKIGGLRTDTKLELDEAARLLLGEFRVQYRATRFKALRGL